MDQTAVKMALAYLCATFRAEVDAWQARAYTRILKGYADDLVWAGAERLVAAAGQGQKYYPIPTAPQWREQIERELRDRRKQAAALHAECQTCDGTRWVDTPRGVVRCQCHQRMMAAMTAVGTPAQLEATHDDGLPDHFD